MKKVVFAVCAMLLLTGNVFSASYFELRRERNKLQKEFFQTSENDYEKMSKITRELTYLYRECRDKNRIRAWYFWIVGLGVSHTVASIKCKTAEAYYQDLHKYYATQHFYDAKNRDLEPIIYKTNRSK